MSLSDGYLPVAVSFCKSWCSRQTVERKAKERNALLAAEHFPSSAFHRIVWQASLLVAFSLFSVAVFLIVDPSYSILRRLTEKISRFRLTTAQRFFPVLQ